MEQRAEKYGFPFRKLEVWSLAVELADFVLRLLEGFPTGRYVRLVRKLNGLINSLQGKGVASNLK